jgi:hypothetical protein
VLSDDVRHVRRQPGPAVAVLVAGLVVGLLLALVTGERSPAQEASSTVTQVIVPPAASADGDPGGPLQSERSESPADIQAPKPAARTDDRWRAELEGALSRAVQAASPYGTDAAAAILVEGWQEPIVAGPAAEKRMQLWSTAKPIAAIAALEAGAASPQLEEAMRDAITRSENCPQRRVILALQHRVGGGDEAIERFRRVLALAGATMEEPVEFRRAEDAQCIAELQRVGQNNTSTPLFGTATWTVRDEVRFAHALATGKYGDAGAQVMGLMARMKQRSLEGTAEDFEADPAFGAGRVLSHWAPAYKSGWGGATDRNYIVTQLISLTRPIAGRLVAIAVAIYPSRYESDDPGDSTGPEGLEAMLGAIADELRRLERSP